MSERCPQNVEQLEERLSRPSQQLVEMMGRLDGDLVLLGVGGKMGPTMARMARRATEAAGRARRVIGVSRFSEPDVRGRLEAWGVETVEADLLDERQVQRLPDAENVVYLVGRKFGSSGNEPLTWAMNAYVPALVARRYARARLVALSTGNVYRPVAAASGGSKVSDPPEPVGEYGMSALGRERIFQYFSQRNETPLAILRLNYATELRYGVLVDLALDVQRRQPIPLDVAHVNVIWLADANWMTLAALEHAALPARVANLAGPETLGVRDVARQFGELLDQPVQFREPPGETSLLSDGSDGHALVGRPLVTADQLIGWTADWIRRAQPLADKPTHFQVTDGRF